MNITTRTSSITNAFINSIIPVITPSINDIREALAILALEPESLLCAYCGDPSTEWDHLRAIVKDKRPTGYISEIRNLVPACGKCNQSKGNKEWSIWIVGDAPQAPKQRGIQDLEARMQRLHKYEEWGDVKPLNLEELIGEDLWEQHWKHWDTILRHMNEAQSTAVEVRQRVLDRLSSKSTDD
ncbi:HNH endonuclease [Amphritea balenae]|uniref:HNH endonuclease n=1 Tax=Amphritea balenae TaxID=452629 RepID=A0A3P1SXI6_9GAMM|nr:HNH endonuclease [Amphritea balenae]